MIDWQFFRIRAQVTPLDCCGGRHRLEGRRRHTHERDKKKLEGLRDHRYHTHSDVNESIKVAIDNTDAIPLGYVCVLLSPIYFGS